MNVDILADLDGSDVALVHDLALVLSHAKFKLKKLADKSK